MATNNPETNFEIKEREYYLVGDNSPVVYIVRSKNIFYYDERSGFERELMLTTNQKTPFVDEFKGVPKKDQIVFRDGVLVVPKEKLVLQKMLSLYHPDKGSIFKEKDVEQVAETELDVIEKELEALNIAKEIDIDRAEAIVRTDVGSRINKMSSKEIRRDAMVLARKNPLLFLELANDENINIRNNGIKAVEQGILILSNDQRTFLWGSNNRKLIQVPFDENPYSALTAWFKTDEGLDIYNQVEKKLK